MRIETFIRRTRISAPVERVFAWHASPSALERLIPPGAPVRLLMRTGGIQTGAVVVFAIGYGPFRIQWVAVHRDYLSNRHFRDVQVRGPFAHWVHTHLFEEDGPDACVLEDHIEYAVPLSWALSPLAAPAVRRALSRLFDYRHAVTRREAVKSLL